MLHLDRAVLSREDAAERLRGWLRLVDPCVLNVAGPRASHDPAIAAEVAAILRAGLPRPA